MLIIVAESTDIFFPIFQVGWLIAFLTFIFLKEEIFFFKNGPPDAVIYNLLIWLLLLLELNKEKCSLSRGIKVFFDRFILFIRMLPPAIKSSLLATAKIHFVLLFKIILRYLREYEP